MNLSSELKRQGYDLIEGPVRNHKVLQLWEKKLTERVEFAYNNVNEAFKSDSPLTITENPALNVNATVRNDFNFNIGITVLEQLLASLGMGNLEISAKITSGKKVSISYDNSTTQEVAIGQLSTFFSQADFNHTNLPLLKSLNADHMLVISGVVLAKNLISEIEIDYDISADVVAKINAIADGKIQLTKTGASNLKMVSSGDTPFPIAVKADRIKFHNSVFKELRLVTDDLNLF